MVTVSRLDPPQRKVLSTVLWQFKTLEVGKGMKQYEAGFGCQDGECHLLEGMTPCLGPPTSKTRGLGETRVAPGQLSREKPVDSNRTCSSNW